MFRKMNVFAMPRYYTIFILIYYNNTCNEYNIVQHKNTMTILFESFNKNYWKLKNSDQGKAVVTTCSFPRYLNNKDT